MRKCAACGRKFTSMRALHVHYTTCKDVWTDEYTEDPKINMIRKMYKQRSRSVRRRSKASDLQTRMYQRKSELKSLGLDSFNEQLVYVYGWQVLAKDDIKRVMIVLIPME